MKKLLAMCILCTVLSGCSSNYRPNTQKGWQLDEINKHSRKIAELDPIIYQQNREVLPARMNQLDETIGFQGRMKARMKAMKDGM